MKQMFKMAMLFVAACTLSMGFVSCGDDDDDNTTSNNTTNTNTGGKEANNSKAVATALIKNYLENVVYPTYTNLADQTEALYEGLGEASEQMENGKLNDETLEVLGNIFLKARAYWEASEAFLYGPATTFGIDPHIDTWPLDVEALARGLSNKEMLNSIKENGASDMAPTLLGFHAIEFVLFRDGKIRTVEELTGNETHAAFANVQITGVQELIYAAAVAEDLMQKCFQLQVAWMGDAAGDRLVQVEEDWELETQIGGTYYGENMLNAGNAGSNYKDWQAAVVEIISAGCSNICNEVANTKMGNAWTGQDVAYIESPYSKKSFLDFYDNIMSIKNSLFGGVDLSAPAENSLMKLVASANENQAATLTTKLEAALAALKVCMEGDAFVDIINSGEHPAHVQAAIDAVNALNEELLKTEKVVAAME